VPSVGMGCLRRIDTQRKCHCLPSFSIPRTQNRAVTCQCVIRLCRLCEASLGYMFAANIRVLELSTLSLLQTLQGPKAAEVLQDLVDLDLKQVFFGNFVKAKIDGADSFITRTGCVHDAAAHGCQHTRTVNTRKKKHLGVGYARLVVHLPNWHIIKTQQDGQRPRQRC